MQKSVVWTLRGRFWGCAALLLLLQAPAVNAIQFTLDYGNGVEGTLNTTVTAGAGWRMQDRSVNLVGKANNNRNVCGGIAQSCQAVFRDQTLPAETLAAAPGQASPNADDGNWNYDRYDMIAAPLKVTQDLKVTYGDFGFFAKTMYFYDFVNNNFTEYHPNRVTSQNFNDPGVGSMTDPIFSIVGGNKVFGPGAEVRNKRTDGETLRQMGTDLQLLDAYFYGVVPFIGDRTLTVKLGRQAVNWGQSTALPINSINQANPVNANNYTRIGNSLEELFIPTGMLFLSTELVENTTIEGFYGYEWKGVEAPTPGTFLATTDVGTNNAIGFASISFGGPAEDPESLAFPLENPLNGVTNTTTTIQRDPDNEPSDQGQYGFSLRYYADWLNNGTELGLYFMNYHSKLPYASFVSSDASCARREGNALGIDAYDPITFLATCNDLPLLHPFDPENAQSNAVPLDSVKFFLEYPEDIHMIGFSYATTLGDYSVQGEIAYRPNLPMQVDLEDLTFGALAPTLSRCHDPDLQRLLPVGVDTGAIQGLLAGIIQGLGLNIGVPQLLPVGTGCAGTTVGVGSVDQHLYGSSDFQDANGNSSGANGSNTFADTFDLLIGAAPGSARSFPSFVTTYRGYKPGEFPNNSYLQGYERFESFQFNTGLTKVIGTTDNFIGADQVILVYEFGANWTPDLPPLDQLQIESPGTYYHASAGADGSGADQSRQACAGTLSCSYGADGLRFNPHQQDLSGYADKFSWGYRVVSIIRYESVLPGISIQPFIIWSQDVHGTMPDVAASFVEGRKQMQIDVETRYKDALSFTLGYTWYTGGGTYNLLRDRDYARFFIKYQF
jgi:hypothetical protein